MAKSVTKRKSKLQRKSAAALQSGTHARAFLIASRIAWEEKGYVNGLGGAVCQCLNGLDGETASAEQWNNRDELLLAPRWLLAAFLDILVFHEAGVRSPLNRADKRFRRDFAKAAIVLRAEELRASGKKWREVFQAIHEERGSRNTTVAAVEQAYKRGKRLLARNSWVYREVKRGSASDS